MRHSPNRVATTLLLAALLAAALNPQSASAQASRPVTRTRFLTIDMLLGGFTAGVTQAVMRHSFVKGFLKGAAGGVAVYGGKCVIAQGHSATDWAGRATVAIGTSAIANASAGRPMLQQITMPFGPLRLERNFKTRKNRSRVYLPGAVLSAYEFIGPRASFSAGESWRHDAIVFKDPTRGTDLQGFGVVMTHERTIERILMTHELIHVTQDDFMDGVGVHRFRTGYLAECPGRSTST